MKQEIKIKYSSPFFSPPHLDTIVVLDHMPHVAQHPVLERGGLLGMAGRPHCVQVVVVSTHTVDDHLEGREVRCWGGVIYQNASNGAMKDMKGRIIYGQVSEGRCISSRNTISIHPFYTALD